jgi:hypothetical protein
MIDKKSSSNNIKYELPSEDQRREDEKRDKR